jgi:hypothetical protein
MDCLQGGDKTHEASGADGKKSDIENLSQLE